MAEYKMKTVNMKLNIRCKDFRFQSSDDGSLGNAQHKALCEALGQHVFYALRLGGEERDINIDAYMSGDDLGSCEVVATYFDREDYMTGGRTPYITIGAVPRDNGRKYTFHS